MQENGDTNYDAIVAGAGVGGLCLRRRPDLRF
jgi:hypothetical protein